MDTGHTGSRKDAYTGQGFPELLSAKMSDFPWYEDFLYVINRTLPQEEIYVTFSYGAIRGEAGTVEGLFCSCYETTSKIAGSRRLEMLRRLGEQAMEADSG